MSATEQRLSQLEARMESVATKGDITEVMARIGLLDSKLEAMDDRLGAMDAKFDALAERINRALGGGDDKDSPVKRG